MNIVAKLLDSDVVEPGGGGNCFELVYAYCLVCDRVLWRKEAYLKESVWEWLHR